MGSQHGTAIGNPHNQNDNFRVADPASCNSVRFEWKVLALGRLTLKALAARRFTRYPSVQQ
jgi:hypothetical protein